MYEELVKLLRDYGRDCEGGNEMCKNCTIQHFCENGWTPVAIADAIEELNRYAAQMNKLREDGWYLLQETDGTYGPITMKMPIPEPLSCDDVLAIINGELPKEEET